MQNGDSIDLNGVGAADFPKIGRGSVVVYGNNGNDTIDLGWAGEIAYGGFGNDSIFGGSGSDTIYGGNGNGTEGGYDYINGMAGNDYLVAESTAGAQRYNGPGAPIPSSTVYGGDGNDYITDADAMDYLSGDGGDDSIVAGNGANRQWGDVIDGGDGDDTITGTSFWDYVDDGDDTINGNGGDGAGANSNIAGGGGNNYLNPPETNPPTPNDYGAPDGSHPQVNGLTVSAATVPDGGQLTLTAKGVGIAKPFDGLHANITVTQVTFWIDANQNGVLDQNGQNGGDKIVGTASGANLKGDISYTVNPVSLAAWGLAPGTYKFFAIAKSSAGFEGDYWFNSVDIVKDKVKVEATSDATEEPPTDGLVTIEREGPDDFDLPVNFSAFDSDGNNDFTVSPASYSIVIPAGQSQAVVHITPIDDEIVESPIETVELDIQPGPFYDLDAPDYGIVRIQEDVEPTFSVSVSPSSVAEGGSVTFTIARSGEMSGEVTVYYNWGGLAVQGVDYTSPGTSVTFADQQTTATVTPTLLDDGGFAETGEDLSLTLEVGDNYVIGSPGSADVAIIEDDDSMDSLMLDLPPRASGAQPPSITPAQIRPFLQAAAHEWEAAGVDPALVNRRLAAAAVHVADLPGSLLGETTDDEIWLDDNAAGYGWFVDDRRKGGGAFALADGPTQRLALPGSPAYGHVDLLTAVTHEVGHLLGLPDLPPGVEPQDIMALAIGLSTRRFPAPGEGPAPSANQTPADAAFGDLGAADGLSGDSARAEPPASAAALQFWQDAGKADEPASAFVGAVAAMPKGGLKAER